MLIKESKRRKQKCQQEDTDYHTLDEQIVFLKSTNNKLSLECQELEKTKKMEEKSHRQELARAEKKMGESTDEYKVLQVKNKEKDQEIKLNEMKIKELKKQIPHNKLRPMHYRKNSTGVSLSSGSPKVISRNSGVGLTEKRHATVGRTRPFGDQMTIAATPKPGRLKLEKLTP